MADKVAGHFILAVHALARNVPVLVLPASPGGSKRTRN
jgi:hypothetical protein